MADTVSFNLTNDTWTTISTESTGMVSTGSNSNSASVWLREGSTTPATTLTGHPLSWTENNITFSLSAGQSLYARAAGLPCTIHVTEE